jgi:hypothetical protein
MPRCILLLVLLLWSAVRLPAQAPLSRVVLDTGQVVVGRVVSMDAEQLHLETTQGVQERIDLSRVLRIERAVPGQVSTPPARPASPASRRAEPTMPGDRGLDQRLESFLHRYAWVIPTDTRNRATLGALLFLLLASVIRLGARMIELPHREFGRCCAMALLLFTVMTVHSAFPVLESTTLLPVVVVADVLLWFVSTRVIFGSTAYESVVMLVFCLFSAVVGVLLVEVAGWVLEIGH